MSTIRKKLNKVFIINAIITILLVTVFINLTINKAFKGYMNEIQNEKYQRIVAYFEDVYNKNRSFTKKDGDELIHEAYMNNYCLTLMDKEKNVIWGMTPNDLNDILHFKNMTKNSGEIYSSKTFDIQSDEEVVGYVEIGHYSPVILSEADINFIASINKSIAISAFIALTIGILISFYLSKQFSKPISEVARMYSKLSNGNFDIKEVGETNIYEIFDLKRSINILANKLKYQDKLRKQLVSDISHEIRTPLNILQNNLEGMIDGVIPITNESLVSLNNEVIRFGKLIDNLDILKKFESESIKLNLQEINLVSLLMQVYNEFEIVAKSKNIKIYYDIQKNNDYSIIGDMDKIKQVLINVLNNAIKFSNEKGKIYIYLYKINKRNILEIKDNGIGISKEDLPYIFERMYRGDKSRNSIEGTGIGLAVVKSILESHNADILVESEMNQGTTFKIVFY